MSWAIAESLAWAAFLGTLGQAVRAVDGVNRLIQQGKSAEFSWFRLAWTLATGAIVGVSLSLGHVVGWETASTYFLAGYVGADLIEKRAKQL